MHRLFTVAVLAILVACDRGTVVDNAPVWKLDSTFTFTGPAAGGSFASIQGLALDADGRLAVADEKGKTVTVFGPSGTFVAPAASVGAGPNDFKEPYSIAWIGEGLAIYDPEMTRVLFTAHGSTKPVSVPVMRVTGSLAARFYSVSRTKAYLRTVRIDGATVRPVFVGFTDGKVADTVLIPNIPTLPTGATCLAADSTTTYFEFPEAPMQVSLPIRDDGTMAFARTDEYRIVLRSPSGDSIGGFSHAFTPVAIKTGEWNESLLAYNKYLVKNGSTSCDAKPTRPEHRAPIRAIALSIDGDFWVTTLRATGLAFDVFGPDGTQKATMPAPNYDVAIPIAVGGDRVAVAMRDAKGGHAVRVLKINR